MKDELIYFLENNETLSWELSGKQYEILNSAIVQFFDQYESEQCNYREETISEWVFDDENDIDPEQYLKIWADLKMGILSQKTDVVFTDVEFVKKENFCESEKTLYGVKIKIRYRR